MEAPEEAPSTVEAPEEAAGAVEPAPSDGQPKANDEAPAAAAAEAAAPPAVASPSWAPPRTPPPPPPPPLLSSASRLSPLLGDPNAYAAEEEDEQLASEQASLGERLQAAEKRNARAHERVEAMHIHMREAISGLRHLGAMAAAAMTRQAGGAGGNRAGGGGDAPAGVVSPGRLHDDATAALSEAQDAIRRLYGFVLDPSNHPAHGGGAKLAVRPAFAKAPTAPASAWASHGGAVGGGAVAALGGRTLDTAFDRGAPGVHAAAAAAGVICARLVGRRGRGAQFRMEGGQVRRVAPVRPSGGDGGGGRGRAPSWYPASAAEAGRAARRRRRAGRRDGARGRRRPQRSGGGCGGGGGGGGAAVRGEPQGAPCARAGVDRAGQEPAPQQQGHQAEGDPGVHGCHRQEEEQRVRCTQLYTTRESSTVGGRGMRGEVP